MTFFHAGSCERFKMQYHGALGVLIVGAAIWNLCAFVERREAKLALNVVLYTSLVLWEARMCARHQRCS